MKFSLNELKKFIDLNNLSIEEIVNRLIFSGFEVEEYYPLSRATNLVVGKVVSCTNHPESDHLHLLKVDCGNKIGTLDIVCGAKNVKTGIKVIVALVGARLESINLTISESIIRGQKSCGMCCSLVELGVNKEFLSEEQINGIEILPDDFVIGSTNVLELLHLDDYVIDINILPNRPDCLSYYGMAREIASLFEKKVNINLKKVNLKNSHETKIKTNKCSRFDLIKIKNIKLNKTPLYIKRILNISSIRSISPLVDLGNYSMLLTGLPVNIYDLDKLDGNLFVVDNIEKKLNTFDDKEIDVKKGDLLIVDNSKPVCIAGIMALKSAQVVENTKNIAIEIACFDSKTIRLSSNRLGLVSFSSNLYSKGRNPLLIDEGVETILSILDIFIDEYKIDSYSSDINKKVISYNKPFKFSLKNLNKRLGSNYTNEDVNRVFKAYNIKVDNNKVCGPIYRNDLKESCDIDEEVFRFYSLDKLNISLSSMPITSLKRNIELNIDNKIINYLVKNHYFQILPYTLIDTKKDELIRVFSNNESYKVRNAMTKDHEIVRSDLLPSMIETIRYNIDHFHTDFKLFEISPIDTKNGMKKYLSFGLVGKKYQVDKASGTNYNFYDLKGDIYNIFELLGINFNRIKIEYSKNDAFHPYASADIYIDKKFVGTFGFIHPKIDKNKFLLGEINLGLIYELKTSTTKFIPFVSSSSIRRELSFEVNEKAKYEDLIKVINENKILDLKEIKLFDIYIDKSNNKFITLTLLFSNEERTLNNNEIDVYIKDIINNVKEKLDISLRN